MQALESTVVYLLVCFYCGPQLICLRCACKAEGSVRFSSSRAFFEGQNRNLPLLSLAVVLFPCLFNDKKLFFHHKPYTPEQNGINERFFRSLKEECVWQHNFTCFEEARRTISQWIHWYNTSRPHQSLGYKSACEPVTLTV